MAGNSRTAVKVLLILCIFLMLLIAGNYRNIQKSSSNTDDKEKLNSTGTVASTQDTSSARSSQEQSAQSSQQTNQQLPAKTQVSAEKQKQSDDIYDQGFQLYLDRKYDEAIKLFDKAIEVNPSSYKAYNGKGISLCFKGNYKEGMDLISKSLELKPDYVYANFNMALAYKLKKDYNVALVWFDKTISYEPKDTWSYFGKACIYAEWNDQAKAIEELRKAIETDPSVKDVARNEPDLNNIKSNPEYIKLVK